MSHLRGRLNAFLDGLGDIPEFSDKRLTDALVNFRDWLEYRVECFESRQSLDGSIEESTAARWYINQVMKEMSVYAQKVEVALEAFTSDGVKAIQEAQKRSQNKLQNMSTVATFFSGVTATTMQYAINQERLGTVVMGLWISSLILSIASAINSQLAMHWRTAMYRSPRSALPIWASVCLDHTPLGCLVGAVLAFFAGLVVWTFAANLAIAVKICAAAMTCATSLILFTVIIWEAGEWWQETKKSQPPPTDAEPIAGMPALHYPLQPWKSIKRSTKGMWTWLSAEFEDKITALGQKWRGFVRGITRPPRADPSTSSLPQVNPNRRSAVGFDLAIRSPKRTTFAEQTSGSRLGSRRSLVSSSGEGRAEIEVQDAEAGAVPETAAPNSPNSMQLPSRKRRDAPVPLIKKVFKLRRATRNLIAVRNFVEDEGAENSRPRQDELRSLRPVQKLPIYHPAGRDIHFSPDGTRLGISVLDGNMAIWDVGAYEEEAQMLPCRIGRFAWSPESSHIVIIGKTGLSIWSKDSEWRLGVEIHSSVRVVAWLKNPSHFLAVIDQVPHIFSTEGEVQKKLNRLPLHVHDLASIPHKQATNYGSVLVLGTVVDDPADEWASSSIFTRTQSKRPKDATAERLLMVIDVDRNACFAEAALLADARHICVSRDGSFALVSYGDGNGDFPQLWQLQDGIGNIQLELCREYTPPKASSQGREAAAQPSISGKARFCGESDEWVMATSGSTSLTIKEAAELPLQSCVIIGSEIYVWDRVTGHLLHTLQASQISSKWPGSGSFNTIISNRISDGSMNLMVVSTCTNGRVVVWEYQAESPVTTPNSGSPSRETTIDLNSDP